MDILITGARSPAALEWARLCLESGRRVWLADSFRNPLSRYVKGAAGYFQLPPAKGNQEAYTQALEAIINRQNIKFVIPTCEEIFYLSHAKNNILSEVEWFMPEESLLFALHNKYLSLRHFHNLGEIAIPQTRLCTSVKDVVCDDGTILKPVYSRFGQHVIRQIDFAKINELPISKLYPWVQQQRITGKQLCNYALFNRGNLIAHQAYLPLYCLNGSAATYFKPHLDERMHKFTEGFGKQTQFHGQVAFDFIEHEDQLYVIECNPRATSGIHLLGSQLKLLQDGSLICKPDRTDSYQIGGTLPLFFGLDALRNGRFFNLIKDYNSAKNVFFHGKFPLKKWALAVAFMELCWLSWRLKRPITETSTYDIEWNADNG